VAGPDRRPDRSAAGQHPGRPRDVLRTADFNDGSMDSFAPDSGTWAVSQGRLKVARVDRQGAVSVFYLDDYLPIYYEVKGKVSMQKPTGGWNANAYVIFDYHSPTDFKFAGLDESTNKLVMGERNQNGWQVIKQGVVQGGVKADKFYDMLVAVNGTHVTLIVDNKLAFTHIFDPRNVDGELVGLNRGMVGVGSNNARGVFDNISAQILPPEITLTHESGPYQLGGSGISQQVIDLGARLQADSYLDIAAKLRTDSFAGVIFDRYAANDFKFVAIDVQGDRLIFGHVDPKRGLQIDHSIARTFDAGKDYTLSLVFKGASVSATVNGSMVGSWGYNSAVVDGAAGVFTRDGTSSFSEVIIRTNDRAFLDAETHGMLATSSAAAEVDSGSITMEQLEAIGAAAKSLWVEALGSDDARLGGLGLVKFGITDLDGTELGATEGGTVLVDVNAAGHGWFVDVSPMVNEEFGIRIDRNVLGAKSNSEAFGRIDLLTVVAHELGHVLGLSHDDAARYAVMDDELDPGVRYLLDELGFDGDPDKPVSDATLLQLAARAAEVEASHLRLEALRKPGVGPDPVQGAGIAAKVDWQSRNEANWGLRLSPFDSAGRTLSPDFAEFEFAPAEDDEEVEEEAFYLEGFDSLGAALKGAPAGDKDAGGKGKSAR
jgi:hypothetical protein